MLKWNNKSNKINFKNLTIVNIHYLKIKISKISKLKKDSLINKRKNLNLIRCHAKKFKKKVRIKKSSCLEVHGKKIIIIWNSKWIYQEHVHHQLLQLKSFLILITILIYFPQMIKSVSKTVIWTLAVDLILVLNQKITIKLQVLKNLSETTPPLQTTQTNSKE